MNSMRIMLILWCVAGLAVWGVLHRVPGWPWRAWIGWACLVLCGPLTWWVVFLLWLMVRR